MANPLFNMLMGQQGAVQRPTAPQMPGTRFQNPVQKMQYILQAMQNPAAFVKRAIPDIPDNIANNPNQILQYLQQTRGISNEQIQQLMGQIPGF